MGEESLDHGRTHEEVVSVMPPVKLLPEQELARLALESPSLDAAVRIARWIAPRTRVTGGGVLELGDARRAARELDLISDEGRESALGAISSAYELPELDVPWSIAEELGLIDIDEDTAEPGRALITVDTATPEELLELWWEAVEVVLAGACATEQVTTMDEDEDGGEEPPGDQDERSAAEEEPVAEDDTELLYNALENLYLITALEQDQEPDSEDTPRMEIDGAPAVPLPVLAASMVMPDDMEAPTDEALEEVSELMMYLDAALQLIVGTGLIDYQPVDPALVIEEDEDATAGDGATDFDDAEVSRYGLVRLTPLGRYGLRRHLLAMGVQAPAVGDLAGASAAALLDAMASYPDDAARMEAEDWLAVRDPVVATRELLAAARGDEPQAPLRRLYCQQVLALLGPEVDAALREVLDDPYLGGLARVRLVEHKADAVPAPSPEMICWLTVDTLAAQLAVDDEAVLQELMGDIPLGEEFGAFFSSAWQVDHPAAVEVLEVLGRLHPDRLVAKEARKAAFKARSRLGHGIPPQ